jgi:polysaccharide biosynthesis protein PslG
MRGRAAAAALLGALLVATPAAASAEPRPLFGVVAQQETTEADFEAMRDGGVEAYRWLVSWPTLQQQADHPPDWRTTDHIVANLAREDIEPIPIISGSPCWVVDCSSVPEGEGPHQPPIDSPQAKLAWAGFVSALVHRYGPGGEFWSDNPAIPRRPIRVWQIWNEQNGPVAYQPRPSPEGYAELLGIAARAIKSSDPDAQVLLGGMFGHPGDPESIPAPEFLDRLYAIPGVAGSFDGVAVHPYSPRIAGVESQIVAMRRVLERNGDPELPIWVTEIGWGTSASGDGRLVETVDGQARRLEQAFGLVRSKRERWNIAGVMWFSWRDTPRSQAVCDWCYSSGLIDVHDDPRPSWAAFAGFTDGDPVAPGGGSGGSFPLAIVWIAAAVVVLAAGGVWLRRRRAKA